MDKIHTFPHVSEARLSSSLVVRRSLMLDSPASSSIVVNSFLSFSKPEFILLNAAVVRRTVSREENYVSRFGI